LTFHLVYFYSYFTFHYISEPQPLGKVLAFWCPCREHISDVSDCISFASYKNGFRQNTYQGVCISFHYNSVRVFNKWDCIREISFLWNLLTMVGDAASKSEMV